MQKKNNVAKAQESAEMMAKELFSFYTPDECLKMLDVIHANDMASEAHEEGDVRFDHTHFYFQLRRLILNLEKTI